MLRSIPQIISPELMKILMEMGHSDTIVLADANYPAASGAKRLIRLEGVQVTDLLNAVTPYFPLDNFVDNPVTLMEPRSEEPTPEIWEEFRTVLKTNDFEDAFTDFHLLERQAFYACGKNAYAIVQTATTARYANIILQKGVV